MLCSDADIGYLTQYFLAGCSTLLTTRLSCQRCSVRRSCMRNGFRTGLRLCLGEWPLVTACYVCHVACHETLLWCRHSKPKTTGIANRRNDLVSIRIYTYVLITNPHIPRKIESLITYMNIFTFSHSFSFSLYVRACCMSPACLRIPAFNFFPVKFKHCFSKVFPVSLQTLKA